MKLTSRKMLHTIGALADLGVEISSAHDFDEVMKASLHMLLGSLAIRKGAIWVYSSRPRQLKAVAAKGVKDVIGNCMPLSKDEAACFVSTGRAFQPGAEGDPLVNFAQLSIEQLGQLATRLTIPMIARQELMGVIFISAKFSGEPFDDEEIDLIDTIARHVGVAIYNHRLLASVKRKAEENRRLYRELRATYQSTIKAFAAAIDLKDAYTKGHSDRVARYSEAIATEMGVTGTELEHISVAGYLHDIGKITVDRAIINNPRPLTEHEFKELNTHVLTGYEILSSINHPWNKIAYMTKCHHERVDGGGYPQGLRGDQIPLGARIVTVADSFDAMMSDRPYRSRLPLDLALAELEKNVGRQFDPDVVRAFCRLLLKEVNGQAPRILTSTSGRGYDRDRVSAALVSMANGSGRSEIVPLALSN
jgi:putative nucleotidyltransferase with HDIG domain